MVGRGLAFRTLGAGLGAAAFPAALAVRFLFDGFALGFARVGLCTLASRSRHLELDPGAAV
jgi:hypothetical protein